MKKLLVGKVVETREATCDFCKEKDKECFTTNQRRLVKEYETSFEWYNQGFLKVGNLIEEVKNTDWNWKENNVDICRDCVKQLAKM